MPLRCLCVFACIAALAACAASRSDDEDSASQRSLIERTKLLDSIDRQFVRISPDGRWLSWLAAREGVLNLWVAPVDQPDRARPLTDERQDRISNYQWAADSRLLLYSQDQGGNQNFVTRLVPVAGGSSRAVTPPDARSQIVAVSPQVPDRVLLSLNRRDPRWPDLYSLDLESGELTPVLRNDGYASFVADRRLQVRLALKARSDGGIDVHGVESGRVEPAPFETIPFEDVRSTAPLGFSADGRTLYWRDSRGRDTAAIVAHDMRNGRKQVLGAHPRADVVAATANPLTGDIDGFEVNPLRSQWTGLTGPMRRDLRRLAHRFDGDLEITSRSDADERWVVLLKPGDRPPTSYLYDRRSGRATPLTDRSQETERAPPGETHAVSIRSRDGLLHAAYLTLPTGSDRAHDGKPDVPLPLVIVVHGGPWERSTFGYQATTAFLASRGYAVLSPNFRASTGFGKAYLSAGDGEYGGKMQDDLIDAAEWAVSRGIARRDRMAIYGGSYGGYAVLAALAFTPREFACGVDLFGTTDLRVQVESDAARRESRRAEYYRRMGDPTTPAGREQLARRSPLAHADAIRRPLLVAQGGNDPQVRKIQSDRLVDALKSRDAPVTYIVFPDEGHGFTKPANVTALRAVTEHFLAQCLGGRAEAFGESLRSSSVVVAHGAHFVDGLEAAARR